MNKALKVINLWAGPGTGKSTTAAGLFNMMKLRKHSVELVTEYATQLVWEKQHSSIFDNQMLLLAKQDHKQRVLVDQVDYCITDSPIFMNVVYSSCIHEYYKSFPLLAFEVFDSYSNINVFLNRVKEYDPRGRNQNLEEAIVKDKEIKKLLDSSNIEYFVVDADEHAHEKIYNKIF